MGVHAGLLSGRNVLGKGVGRQRHNGDPAGIRAGKLSDLPGRIAAVHHRHLHIHENRIKGKQPGILKRIEGFLPVPCLDNLGAAHGKKIRRHLHVDLIVFR